MKRVLIERDESKRSRTNLGAVQHRTQTPTWEHVLAALARLDGKGFSDVMLSTGSGANAVNLSVSGGVDGRALCSVARPDHPDGGQEFSWLVDDAAGDAPVTQVCGGQAGVYPAWMNVPREKALTAARYFFGHAAEDPSLTWRRL